MNWKELAKFDAHVHVLPVERVTASQAEGTGTGFGAALNETMHVENESETPDAPTIYTFLREMDANAIEKALLVPTNSPKMYFDMRGTNEFLAECVRKAPDRLFAFSDLQISDSVDLYETPAELEYAIKELGLCGLKIHPGNSNIPIDDWRYIPILRKAAELRIPVMIHSYPWGPGFYDMSAPERINHMMTVFPDISFITAHMGGMRYLDAIRCVGQVDISGTLFDLVDLYGIEGANRILRKFGVERLIFASDYPFFSYEKYFSVLDQMDFTDDEKERIAYKNISDILSVERK